MSQERIFVSHSHKDEEFTQRLVDDLHTAGAEVWVDVAGISHGNFMQHIDEALAQCSWMVLVLTPNAIASQYVADEVYAALHRVKQGLMRAVVPVLAAPCAPGSIPPQWDVLHRYDATRDHAAALAGVVRAIGLSLAADVPPPAATPEQQAESLDGLIAQGKAFIVKKDWAQAVFCFQRATKLDATSFDAWANMARALINLGRYAEALVGSNRALALDNKNAAAWANKGMALSRLKRYEEALAADDQSLALDPKDAITWNNKGVHLRQLDRYEEALAEYDRALALNPNYALAWHNKGWVLHLLKRDEEALDAYDCALAADPKYVDTWKDKAASLRVLGRETEAEEAMRHAKGLEA